MLSSWLLMNLLTEGMWDIDTFFSLMVVRHFYCICAMYQCIFYGFFTIIYTVYPKQLEVLVKTLSVDQNFDPACTQNLSIFHLNIHGVNLFKRKSFAI